MFKYQQPPHPEAARCFPLGGWIRCVALTFLGGAGTLLHLAAAPHLSACVFHCMRPWFGLPAGFNLPSVIRLWPWQQPSPVRPTAHVIFCHAGSCTSAHHSSRTWAFLEFPQLSHGLSCRNQFHMINFNTVTLFFCILLTKINKEIREKTACFHES